MAVLEKSWIFLSVKEWEPCNVDINMFTMYVFALPSRLNPGRYLTIKTFSSICLF